MTKKAREYGNAPLESYLGKSGAMWIGFNLLQVHFFLIIKKIKFFY